MGESLCRWCSEPVPVRSTPGRPLVYCNAECRKAYYNETRRDHWRKVVCEWCETDFATGNPEKRFCSEPCRRKAERERLKPWLSCATCEAKYQGHRPKAGNKSYCSSECQAEGKRWRYMKRSVPVPWDDCGICGVRFVDSRGTGHCFSCVPRRRRKPATLPPHSGWVSSRPRSRRWYAGNCAHCGDAFVTDQPAQRCCGPRCARRLGKERRRVNKRQAYVEDVWRKKVYARDEWTCRICNEPVDPDAVVPDHKAPTLDHIVPLALGGDHSYANVQTAHFICNARKSDSLEGQLCFAA